MRILFFVLFLSVLSCKSYEPLTKTRVPFTGSDIRLDGYYFLESEGIFCSFFLYQNGLFLSNGCSSRISTIPELDSLLADNEFQQRKNENQYVWGVFQLHNHTITIDRWESWNGTPFKIKRSTGDVFSNTSISTSAMKNIDNQEVYNFRHFSPKPDSTNVFIP